MVKDDNVEERSHADPLRCPGCGQRYRYGGGVRQPRALGCGHTLCQLCIIDKIKEPKSPRGKPEFHCPSCGAKYVVRNASDFPISEILVDLLQLGAADGSSCLMHGQPRNLHCRSCTAWICQGCTKINHPAQRCIVQSLDEARSGLEVQQNRDLKQAEETWTDQLQQLKFQTKDKRQSKTVYSARAEEFVSMASKLKTKISSMEIHLQEAQRLLRQAQEIEATKPEISNVIDDSKIASNPLEAVGAPLLAVQSHLAGLQQWSAQARRCIHSNTRLNEKTFKESAIKVMLASLVDVLGETTEEQEVAWLMTGGGSLCCPLSLLHGRYHLHHLQEDQPPPHTLCIPYISVLQVCVGQPVIAFLDLGWDDEVQGRLYIQTKPDNEKSRQFVEMCTGQNGISFADTFVWTLVEDGFGGKKIIFGSNQKEDVNNHSVQNETKKSISSPPAYKSAISEARLYRNNIGQLMGNGMDILRKAVKELDKRDVKIMQCGIVVYDSQTSNSDISNSDKGLIFDDKNNYATSESIVQQPVSPRPDTDNRRRLQPIPGLVISHEHENNKNLFAIILTESDQAISPISLSFLKSSALQSFKGKEIEPFKSSSSVSNDSINEENSTSLSFDISNKASYEVDNFDKNKLEKVNSKESTLGTSSRLKKSLPKLHIQNQAPSVIEWSFPLKSRSSKESGSANGVSESEMHNTAKSTSLHISEAGSKVSPTSPKISKLITPQTTLFLPNFRSNNAVTTTSSKMFQSPVSLISPKPYTSKNLTNMLNANKSVKSSNFIGSETSSTLPISKFDSTSVRSSVSLTSLSSLDTSNKENAASPLNESKIESTSNISNIYEKLPNKLELKSIDKLNSSSSTYTPDLDNRKYLREPTASNTNSQQNAKDCSSAVFSENTSKLDISSNDHSETEDRKSALPTIMENLSSTQSYKNPNESINPLYEKLSTKLEFDINEKKSNVDRNPKITSSLKLSSKIHQEVKLDKTIEPNLKSNPLDTLVETSSNSEFNELPSTKKSQTSQSDDKIHDTKSAASSKLTKSPFNSDKYKTNSYSSPYPSKHLSSQYTSPYDKTNLYKKLPNKLENSISSTQSKQSTQYSIQKNKDEEITSIPPKYYSQNQQMKHENVNSNFKSQDQSLPPQSNSSIYEKISTELDFIDKQEKSIPPGEHIVKNDTTIITPQINNNDSIVQVNVLTDSETAKVLNQPKIIKTIPLHFKSLYESPLPEMKINVSPPSGNKSISQIFAPKVKNIYRSSLDKRSSSNGSERLDTGLVQASSSLSGQYHSPIKSGLGSNAKDINPYSISKSSYKSPISSNTLSSKQNTVTYSTSNLYEKLPTKL